MRESGAKRQTQGYSKGIDRYLLVFLFFFYLFLLRDFLEQYIGVVKYADEIFALLAVPLFILGLRRDRFQLKLYRLPVGYGRWITLLMVIGVVSSLWFHYQPMTAVLSDGLLVAKFWLALYTGKHLLQGLDVRKNAGVIFMHIKGVTLLYTILFVLDHLAGGLFPILTDDIRYGLHSTRLFYSRPTIFAGCCIFLIAVLLSIRDWVRGSGKYFVLLLLLISSTLRSKAFGAALAIALIYYFAYKWKRKIGLGTVLLFVPLVIMIGWGQIMYYFFSSIQGDSARYQLLDKSIQIAIDHFPLGAGFATFGSYFSSEYYSPLYGMYGISRVFGLSAGFGAFISDSFWPMILGQFGWLGLICYGAALLALFMRVQAMRRVSRPFYVSGLSILAYLLITSMAEAAFVHPLAIPLAMWLGALFQMSESGKNDNEPAPCKEGGK